MRSVRTLVFWAAILLAPGVVSAQAPAVVSDADREALRNAAPVVVSDHVREALPNDYLRITFVSAGTSITTLSRPGSLRAFATATPLYSPPLTLADFPAYSGLINVDSEVLVAMRCRPRNPETADAVLATWPNVFLAIQRDLSLNPTDCSSSPPDVPTQVGCFAYGFSDTPAAAVPTALSHTFSYAATLYDGAHTPLAEWLQSNYGIYPAFAGTGYSVKDSYYLSSSEPLTSQQILVKSISSEYVLKNVALADAGCSCISVPPYQGRSNDRLDPEFILVAGGYGACSTVNKLRVLQDER
jgi:hypothetical protein